MILRFSVKALRRAVLEGHVLQFALAARIAHRAIQRMVAQQQLQRGLARLDDLRRIGEEDLAFRDLRRARRLQLRHLLLAHHAHAASCLQRESRIVAERRNLDARTLAGLNQQRARRCGDLLAVDGNGYIWHKFLRRPATYGASSRSAWIRSPGALKAWISVQRHSTFRQRHSTREAEEIPDQVPCPR